MERQVAGVYGDEGDVRMGLETLGSLRPIMNRGSVAALQYPLGSGGVAYFALAASESVNDALIKVKDYLRSVGDVLRRSEEDYERRRVKVTGGEFNGVTQAIMDVVSWNTMWDPYNARIYTVVSRERASGPWFGYLLLKSIYLTLGSFGVSTLSQALRAMTQRIGIMTIGVVGFGEPMNYIVYEGLRRYGFDEVAYEFALKSVKLFMGEWLKNGHYNENYNAETGEGDDVPNSDPYYS